MTKSYVAENFLFFHTVKNDLLNKMISRIFHTVNPKHTVEKWKIHSHQNFFRQINSLVIYLVNALLARSFCQKSVRVIFCHFHIVRTPHCGNSAKTLSRRHFFVKPFSKILLMHNYVNDVLLISKVLVGYSRSNKKWSTDIVILVI